MKIRPGTRPQMEAFLGALGDQLDRPVVVAAADQPAGLRVEGCEARCPSGTYRMRSKRSPGSERSCSRKAPISRVSWAVARSRSAAF